MKRILALALCLLASPALAQGLPKLKPLTGDLGADLGLKKGTTAVTPGAVEPTAGTVDSALSTFNGNLQKLTKELVDKAIADVTAAQLDATNHNDVISLPCWNANLTLLNGLPTQWQNPPTFPVGLALGIQIQRDLLNSITGDGATSLKVACAALWGDQLKIVANVAALLGIRVATGGLF